MIINPIGNVGIGTMTPTAKLSVNGTINNTTGTISVFSDARIKTVDADFTDGLNVINKIRPVRFHFNSNAPYNSEEEQIGVVAQEPEQIAPYMVKTTDWQGDEEAGKPAIHDLKEVNNQAYIFLLINSIQEQQSLMEGQQAAIAEQQKSINALRAEIEILKNK